MAIRVQPLSGLWGFDRGLPIHRHYLERFLQEFSADIRGYCLEFELDYYTSRFGGTRVSRVDVLHLDASNRRATIVADLTKPNDIPSDLFDCIICTHVLHIIYDFEKAVSELHRILKPGGILLVAVPSVSMYGQETGELWRFVPNGLRMVLATVFGIDHVIVRGYGNSLVAAAELRGLVAHELTQTELDTHDPRFPVEVCARAVKRAPGG
jgi:SAM-dependent methyltransferase